MPSRSRMVPISCGCTPASVNDRMLALSCAVPDRKSTRLNSSHSQISYAVFCLKKKKEQHPALALANLRVLQQTHSHPLPCLPPLCRYSFVHPSSLLMSTVYRYHIRRQVPSFT